MYFYHGNKHYYLTRIFLYDQALSESLYLLELTNEKYKDLCFALADELLANKGSKESFDSLIKSKLSANEYYDSEIKKYRETKGQHTSTVLFAIQNAINRITGKTYTWTSSYYKVIYVSILKSCFYGAIKHFFYENRDKYLPQYDWYLINSNPKRKEIMEILFSEFDKLATISDSLRYYQDADDIPEEFLIRLQEITGLTLNDYNGILTAEQIRNLTKHLIEVWREKGALYSIELFFACLGIDCALEELWFDRRLYYNSDGFNEYTKINSIREFGYYLTPRIPQSATYSFSSENVDYAMYTAPKPSRIWDYTLRTSTSSESETIRELLGYKDSDKEVTYTFFKSNYLLFNFNYINQTRAISKSELTIFKEMVDYMLPIYMRTIYINDYGASTGDEGFDIIIPWDMNSSAKDNITEITDENNNKRPAEIFKFFDTQNVSDVAVPPPYAHEKDGGIITDFYPPAYCGLNFVSGSFIVVNDTRLEQFIGANFEYSKTKDTVIDPEKAYYTYDFINDEYVVVEEPDVSELSDYYEKTYYFKATVTSGRYDTIGGIRLEESGEETEEQIEALKCYPLFYDDEGHNYYRGSNKDELVKDDGQWYEASDGSWIKSQGTVGALISTMPDDKAYEYNVTIDYIKTTDVEINPEKTYYVYDSEGEEYIPVEDPITSELENYYEYQHSETTVYNKVTRYFFEVNGEDPVEIYPVLFADNKNDTKVEFVQGYFDAPFYKEVMNPNSDDFPLYFEFVKTEDTEAVSGKTYYVLEDGVYKAVENPRGSELENYYEFVKASGSFDPEKTYYIPTFRDETFGLNIEPQIDFTYDVYNTEENKWETFAHDTFDQDYTNEPQNLFEASTWRENIPAINDLYNDGEFKGEIQYEYFEYSNPIQYLEANLNAPLEITLI